MRKHIKTLTLIEPKNKAYMWFIRSLFKIASPVITCKVNNPQNAHNLPGIWT